MDKYQNPDPRCGYPYTPDPAGYCWMYAYHVDGSVTAEGLERECRRCEYWRESAPEEGRQA